jgi:hypothetical protein
MVSINVSTIAVTRLAPGSILATCTKIERSFILFIIIFGLLLQITFYGAKIQKTWIIAKLFGNYLPTEDGSL